MLPENNGNDCAVNCAAAQPIPQAPADKHAEARRLLGKGFKLCRLHPMSKQPFGDEWQKNPVQAIDPDAGGYGLPLAVNGLCSVDPDNLEPAREGLARCGFDLDALMLAGVRTSSTRPGSGGRSTFKDAGGLRWIKFASKRHGTILELRAASSNLQDCLPGTVYLGASGAGPYEQHYANGRTLDEAPELPADVLAWWQRLSADVEFLRGQQALLCGPDALLSVSSGDGTLAYGSPMRQAFNAANDVPGILERHGYTTDERGRWAPPTATGAPSVRPIPGRAGLWQSDHASDALHGTFDAWTAFVALDHSGGVQAAEAAWRPVQAAAATDGFEDVPVQETAQPRYRLLSAGELRALPALAWRVRGVLPAAGLAAIYGPSASGKSFLALDMAAAIAEGSRWFGCRVEAAPVVYAALEGEAGFKLRAQAWETSRSRALPAGLRMVLQPFRLTEPQDVRDLAAVVPAGAVVILDTLNRAAPTADENSSRDMGLILLAAKRLQSATGGLVLMIHHTGKDSARGLRGHSSLFAALDAAVEVSREGERREWRVAKAKDGADGRAQGFALNVVDLGLDADGEMLTSCVVEPAGLPVERKPLSRNQRVALDAFEGLALFSDAVDRGEWRESFYGQVDGTPQAKRQAFHRAVSDLTSAGRVCDAGGGFTAGF